jgi:hypothetical protein
MPFGGDGWMWLIGTRKAHWIKSSDGRSLCGKWLYLGSQPGSKHDPDDCKTKYACVGCKRELAKLQEKAA